MTNGGTARRHRRHGRPVPRDRGLPDGWWRGLPDGVVPAAAPGAPGIALRGRPPDG